MPEPVHEAGWPVYEVEVEELLDKEELDEEDELDEEELELDEDDDELLEVLELEVDVIPPPPESRYEPKRTPPPARNTMNVLRLTFSPLIAKNLQEHHVIKGFDR